MAGSLGGATDGQPMMMGTVALTICLFLAIPAYGAELNICVLQIQKGDEDFREAFRRGAIRVPAGTVFDFAGHAFGPVSDPRDMAHSADHGWRGVSPEENDRRIKLTLEDVGADQRHKAGLVTLQGVALTSRAPCVSVSVAATSSASWGWTVAPVLGSSETYFQLFGVIRGRSFDTGFEHDDQPLDYVGVRGMLNGMLTGTTDRVVPIPD